MKIEKGKFYKSRDGRKWEVLTTERNSGDYPIVAISEDGDIESFSINGHIIIDNDDDEDDLIAEWTEPVEIPWRDYPTWCKWVAMDKDGEWCGFVNIPRQRSDGWYSMDVSFYIPTDYTPRNFTGDWTESLFERP
jgi:hypothetical protein